MEFEVYGVELYTVSPAASWENRDKVIKEKTQWKFILIPIIYYSLDFKIENYTVYLQN